MIYTRAKPLKKPVTFGPMSRQAQVSELMPRPLKSKKFDTSQKEIERLIRENGDLRLELAIYKEQDQALAELRYAIFDHERKYQAVVLRGLRNKRQRAP